MPRAPIPSRFFAMVIVRHENRFLLIQENLDGNPWYIPAGGVEPGENLFDAAIRETLEEAGVAVRLEGIVRIKHAAIAEDMTRVHVIFLASPAGDPAPKCTPDEHSQRAAWFTLEEMADLPQRSPAIPTLIAEVAAGAPVSPLSLLSSTGLSDGG